jgi:hypothetical protein
MTSGKHLVGWKSSVEKPLIYSFIPSGMMALRSAQAFQTQLASSVLREVGFSFRADCALNSIPFRKDQASWI